MTDAHTPSAGQNGRGEQYASTQSVAGLAREVEQLSRKLKGLDDLPGKVKQLARTVSQLAAEVARSQRASAGGDVVSWLGLPDEEEYARGLLDELTGWMHRVYLRYADAASSLPNCWLWHPDVVEELLWLWQSWAAAYVSEDATVATAADWHDRYRPGVVRRIGKLAPNCSLEQHLHARRTRPGGVPAVSAVPAIAQWWGDGRQHCGIPPEPTPEQLTEESDEPGHRGGGPR